MSIETLYTDAFELLKQLIATESFSRAEQGTADIVEGHLKQRSVATYRLINNIWAVNKNFDPANPSILLNSHHDTVKPSPGYTKDPFSPVVEEGKLYGLGSNDAGGCLVSLIAAFLHFYHDEELKYNLIIAATAEEEISGKNGIELLLKDPVFNEQLNNKPPDCAIVGEPTMMQLAVAEKGLMVLDCVAIGKAGHAAREEGDNAIYKAVKDIGWISNYKFSKVSEWLGDVKMNVTVIETENKAHNVVPAECRFAVDVRITDEYTQDEVLETIRQNVESKVTPRSTRLRSTRIDIDHPLVKAGNKIGKTCYGSPTISDKAIMAFPALKCGPGDSARSHTADEYIYLEEIKGGIVDYITLLEQVLY